MASGIRVLARLDRARHRNRVDPIAGLTRDTASVLQTAVGMIATVVMLAYATAKASHLDTRLGTWLPMGLAIGSGIAIGRGVARMQAHYLFRAWIRVLPLPPGAIVRHWQRTTARRTLALGALAAACLALSVMLAGRPAIVIGAAAAMTLAATLLALAWVRTAGPVHAATPSSSVRFPAWPALRALEPSCARWLGLWQARLRWTPRRIAGMAMTGLAGWIFAMGVGRAQHTALPVLLVAVLLAAAVFNQSLEGRVLHATALRTLPLRPAQRIRTWLHAPICLSALAGVLCAVIGLQCLPHVDVVDTLPSVALAGSAWAGLCMLRIATVLRWPNGGLPADLAYMAGLLAFWALVQSVGPAAGALALAWLVIDIVRSVRRL